jgi:hypothetical protein
VHRAAFFVSLVGLGCTDTFALPVLDGGADGGAPPADAAPDASTIAAACQDTGCTMDGDVVASSGMLTGCHIYGTFQVTSTVIAHDFKACAQTIIVDGTLSADAQGEDPGAGPGGGEICGSGGGHGGRGGPLACAGGATYGDMAMPRTRGSGGGGIGGGRGGGTIELHAMTLQLAGTLSANGEDSQVGVVSGGGAGGSILVVADSIGGSGAMRAGGGTGGLGGGGGGGRIAVYGVLTASPTFAVPGGGSNVSSSVGAPGSIVRP